MKKTKFKVVHYKTRKGTNWTLNSDQTLDPTLLGDPLKYVNIYTKGETIHAVKSTLGIFVFHTRKQAKAFIAKYVIKHITKILRVRPIGRGKVPKVIVQAGACHTHIIDFYIDLYQVITTNPPTGTICYPAVEVLD